jgi:hypothetical protein
MLMGTSAAALMFAQEFVFQVADAVHHMSRSTMPIRRPAQSEPHKHGRHTEQA